MAMRAVAGVGVGVIECVSGAGVMKRTPEPGPRARAAIIAGRDMVARKLRFYLAVRRRYSAAAMAVAASQAPAVARAGVRRG